MFLLRLYDRLIVWLAVLSASSFAFITGAIVVDVAIRNAGYRSMIWTSAVVEYVLLFATMMAGPWLIRVGGHVAVTSFVAMMPDVLGRAIGRIVMIASIVLLGVLSWRAAVIGLDEAAFGAVDMRSINVPGWLAYALISAGMGLMAIETLRQLLAGAAGFDSRRDH